MTVVELRGPAAAGTVGRYVWHPVRVPEPPSAPHALARRVVAVLGGQDQDRAAVSEALRAAGAEVLPVEGPRPDEDAASVAARSRDAVAAGVAGGGSGRKVDLLVDLNGCSAAATSAGPWRAAFAQTVAAVQAVYDDWAGERDARRCGYLAVTRLGGRMGYDGQGITHPLGGVWAGLAKSLPHELPACRVKVLDLGGLDAPELARLVVVELGVFDFYEIGRREGERTTLACAEEEVPAPRVALGPDDTVLVSGGARGIGFSLAVALATEHRCQVVVTGRRPLPDPHEPWLALDDDAFGELQRRRLVEAAGGDVAGARRTNAALAAARESAANLADARRRGLPVRYEQCDVQSLDDVRRVVEALGERLRLVVHNAGVAAPTRLRGKSIDVVLDVVGCKLGGFLNLAEALRGREPTLLCNVGSASGRMGGMVGQVDYAAANEALARLGFWASAQRGLPVSTLAWTTWDRVGLIANFEAALRYGTALSVDEGVARWVAELLAATPGEAMFLGRVGTALVPSQLAGFRKFADHPDYPALHSLHHFLGELTEYRPFRSVRSTHRIPGGHPWAAEVALAGRAAIPVGIALEYAAAAGEWVSPPGWPVRHLAEIRDLRVDLAGLVLDADVELEREGHGATVDGRWCVDVVLSRREREVLRATLSYEDDVLPTRAAAASGSRGDPPRNAPSAAGAPMTGRPGALSWRGRVLPAAVWTGGRDRSRGAVRKTRPADLWALPTAPRHLLPTTSVEAIVAAHVTRSEQSPVAVLEVRSLRRLSDADEAEVDGCPATGRWTVRDADGAPVLALEGVTVR